MVRSKLLSQFLEIDDPILPDRFLEEISHFSRKIVSISGGIDSAAAALALFKKGIKCELLWNNTRRSMPEARKTVVDLIKITGWEFHITYPRDKMSMINRKLREQVEDIIEGRRKYQKHNFSCCYYLKEKPLMVWIRENPDQNMIVISSIAGYESMQRQIRLGELRNKKTFLRYQKKYQCWFGYPWRDMTNRKHGDRLIAYVHQYLPKVQHSGCLVCPILAIVEENLLQKMEAGQDRIDRSRKVYLAGNDA